jgi:REP element-mobilizing transposase RayT
MEAGGGPADAEALAALEGKPAIYHCISRIVWRELALGGAEKEHFVRLMRKWEAFCRVRVLTFCVMSSHFHILVEVPERPEEDPGDEELLDHLGLVYGARKLAEIRWELEHWRGQGNEEMAEALRQRFLRRMWDLSFFMKALKQAFSKWFNKRHGKKGNLWEDKFKSLLVEDGHAARVVAGYIDLNPVRAGIAERPEGYRWSGWGEAVAGRPKAREGIARVMLERELGRSGPQRAVREVSDWNGVSGEYRELMAKDEEKPARRGNAEGGGGRKRAIPGNETGGQRQSLGEAGLLHRKVRYFADGMVIGSKGFVDGVFRLTKGWFGGKRKSGARRIGGANTSLRSMRALRVQSMG